MNEDYNYRARRNNLRSSSEQSVRLERNRKNLIPVHLKEAEKILLLRPEEKEKMGIGVHFRENRFSKFLQNFHPNIVEKKITLEINKSLKEELKTLAKTSKVVIFDTSFQLSSGQVGILTEGQIEFLKGLSHINPNLIIFAINPFVISQIPFVDTVLFTYSNNEYVLKTALEIIFGKQKAKGRLPAKNKIIFYKLRGL